MTSRERVDAVLSFNKPDRLPVMEWAPYWNQTMERWHSEGLPVSVKSHREIQDFFGLDPIVQLWPRSLPGAYPRPNGRGRPVISSMDDYERIMPYLYPEPAVDPAALERVAREQEAGTAVWLTLDGFFWHQRELLGIEEHLYAFYDHPEIIKRLNMDNARFICRAAREICARVSPQFLTMAEDMSYNHGPMLSKALFDEFVAPPYLETVPFLKSLGLKVIVDSDGLVDEPVDWYSAVGCEGFLPLEHQAGVDLVKYRCKHPRLLFVGGFDKMCMNQGEEALRREFERLLPVMKQGGYIPGVDHQTPPQVSFDDYKLYLSLLREYCAKAVSQSVGEDLLCQEK